MRFRESGWPGRSAAASGSADGIEADPILPLTVYGPEPSYFTGKLEAVVRFMELPYQRIAKEPTGEVARATGVAQVPGLLLADDRWLTDTTPIIAWLDEHYPDTFVIPRDPVVAFFSRLLEDYADEWLWRPAMHYRRDYPLSAAHMSRVLVDEVTRGVKLPGFAKRHLVRTRQRDLFTKGDGVSSSTWGHVEKIYLDTLSHLSKILKTRPFLLGTRPSLADFGVFGPSFRHFAQDPASARIMRETAGMMPGPLQAVYYATKSFVVSFSQAIAEELADTGVTSTALCPGAVDTGFVEAGELEGAALFQKPGASPGSVAACGYEAMLKGDLVKINEPSLSLALGWVIPLLPRKAVLKMSRKSMEKKP